MSEEKRLITGASDSELRAWDIAYLQEVIPFLIMCLSCFTSVRGSLALESGVITKCFTQHHVALKECYHVDNLNFSSFCTPSPSWVRAWKDSFRHLASDHANVLVCGILSLISLDLRCSWMDLRISVNLSPQTKV